MMTRDQALTLAKEHSTDLIQTVPHATPPVARLMNFDKYRYQKEKEEKKGRLAQKNIDVKQVQISVRAAENDLQIKLHQLEKFIEAGHPVEIRLRLRGREKRNTAWALQKMSDFLKMITVPYKTVSEPKAADWALQHR